MNPILANNIIIGIEKQAGIEQYYPLIGGVGGYGLGSQLAPYLKLNPFAGGLLGGLAGFGLGSYLSPGTISAPAPSLQPQSQPQSQTGTLNIGPASIQLPTWMDWSGGQHQYVSPEQAQNIAAASRQAVLGL